MGLQTRLRDQIPRMALEAWNWKTGLAYLEVLADAWAAT